MPASTSGRPHPLPPVQATRGRAIGADHLAGAPGPGLCHGARSESLLADVSPAEIISASRARSPKADHTSGDLRLTEVIEGQASRCAIRIDAAAKTIAA